MAKTTKRRCQIRHRFGCNGQGVRLFSGTEKKNQDLKIWCCMGCYAMLRREGYRLKQVNS